MPPPALPLTFGSTQQATRPEDEHHNHDDKDHGQRGSRHDQDAEGIDLADNKGPQQGIHMKLSINSRRKFNGFMLLAQAFPQYLGCGLSFA
jgi:hypothetical protein